MKSNCVLCGRTLYMHNISKVRSDGCGFCYPEYVDEIEEKIYNHVHGVGEASKDLCFPEKRIVSKKNKLTPCINKKLKGD